MKTIRIFSLLVAFALVTGSCEKDFDPKIYGALFTTNFPQTEQDYEAYMMICYVPFSVNWTYNMTGVNQHNWYVTEGGFMRMFDSTSDYCAPWIIGSWGGDWRRMTQGDFSQFVNRGRGSGGSPSHFEKVRDITRFTEVIGVLEKATVLSDQKKRNLIGEARFLRGMMMYYMLHIYGPVPVLLDPELVGNYEAETNMERPTLSQMAQWITDDLKYGAENMASTGPRGRYTANYARFCLMRHYLNEGEHMAGYYANAILLYDELKSGGYSLFMQGTNPYAEQFKQARKFNSEVIMAVSTSAAGDGSGSNGNFNPTSWYVIPGNASRYEDAANTIPTPFVNQGGGWGQIMNVIPSFYDTYEETDLRREVILTSYVRNNAARTVYTRDDIGVAWDGFIINKYPVEIVNAFQPTDIPLARWADVLLMYAEAVARRDQAVPTGEALQAVNDVRARAGLDPLSGAAVADYDGFMEAMLLERGHEFLYEGGRKIDLIRFNRFRRNYQLYKNLIPTHQYIPLPNYAVEQAASYGKTLDQFYERPGYASDN
jgi:starch-binding outer membrane protein, SusD/RagB family